MRIYDDRYTRERLRFHVALRFIRLEARTHTIRQWTGLSDDRIRKLYRSYLAHSDRAVLRHRGKSPRRVAAFLRTTQLRQESALLASLCRLLGALPATRSQRGAAAGMPVHAARAPGASPANLPSLPRAQLLCDAYELYRALLGAPALGFEHAVFLLEALWAGEELVCASCPDCQALMVMDRWELYAPRCAPCAQISVVDASPMAVGASPAAARTPGEAADDLPLPQPLCKTPRDGTFHERLAP